MNNTLYALSYIICLVVGYLLTTAPFIHGHLIEGIFSMVFALVVTPVCWRLRE